MLLMIMMAIMVVMIVVVILYIELFITLLIRKIVIVCEGSRLYKNFFHVFYIFVSGTTNLVK